MIKGAASELSGDISNKGIMIRNTDRLLNLVNQLLELSKLENGDLSLNMTRINVIALIREIFEAFEPVANRKDIQLHFYAQASEFEMDCDIEVIYRIVGNLISNAVKFTPEVATSILKSTPSILKPGQSTFRSRSGIRELELQQIKSTKFSTDSTRSMTPVHVPEKVRGLVCHLRMTLSSFSGGQSTCTAA